MSAVVRAITETPCMQDRKELRRSSSKTNWRTPLTATSQFRTRRKLPRLPLFWAWLPGWMGAEGLVSHYAQVHTNDDTGTQIEIRACPAGSLHVTTCDPRRQTRANEAFHRCCPKPETLNPKPSCRRARGDFGMPGGQVAHASMLSLHPSTCAPLLLTVNP